MPFIGSKWVPGPGEPQQAPQRIGSRVVGAPTSAPQVQPNRVMTAPTTVPGASGNTVESGNKPWLDWITKTYGQSASRGGGFADSGGVGLEQAIQRYNAETGANAKYMGGSSMDKADFGAGTVDALTGEGQFWSSTGGTPGAPGGGGGGGGSDPRLHDGIKGNAGGPTAPAAPGGGNTDMWNQLYQTLLERSNQGLAVDRNNPVIRAQSDAYSANEERSKRDYLADFAEKSGPTANVRGETRLAAERVGQRTGGFEAELMGRELTAKRDEIAQALSQRGAMLTESQRQQLTLQLAKMDDAVRRYQIQTQDSQFGRSLAQGESEFGRTRADQTTDRNNYWDSVRSGLI